MNNHDPLSDTLKTWRHEPPEDPEFSSAVWSRIHADKKTSAPANVLRFPIPLSLAASFAVILAGLAGTGAGLALGHRQSDNEMAAAYVRSIDPLQMTAMTSAHAHS